MWGQNDPNALLPAAGDAADPLFPAGAAASSGYGYRQLAASTGGLDANLMTADWSKACYEATASPTGYHWLPAGGPEQRPILEYTESQICATALDGDGGDEGESLSHLHAMWTGRPRPAAHCLGRSTALWSGRLPPAVRCRGRRLPTFAELSDPQPAGPGAAKRPTKSLWQRNVAFGERSCEHCHVIMCAAASLEPLVLT